MRSGKAIAIGLAAMIAIAAATDLSAHRRDEYLQAARIAVAPGQVELQLDLTPGTAIADTVIADIDRDRDGRWSDAEQDAYVAAIAGSLELTIDGRPLDIVPSVHAFPDAGALRSGDGMIRLRSIVMLPRLPNGDHQLTFRNGHRPDVSVYLANALVPDGDAIVIAAQTRDAEQRELTIAYAVSNRSSASAQAWLAASVAAAGLLIAVYARKPC